MTLVHSPRGKAPRKFRPSGNSGGSRPGKPQGRWPVVLLVVADAVCTRAKGTQESWLVDRNSVSSEVFGGIMDSHCPGWRDWFLDNFGPRDTPLPRLLLNRVYKMYYSGTSDRGPGHDPLTRATYSSEHWTRRVPADSPLTELYQSVLRGVRPVIHDWKDYL